jgi:hypothetical protein
MARHTWLGRLGFALVVALSTACGKDSEQELSSCEPLVGSEQPTTLGTVLGVGQDKTGNLYVVDERDGERRVFRSNPSGLVRMEVTGTVDEGSGATQLMQFVYRWPLSDATGFLALLSDGSATVRMAVSLYQSPRGDFEAVVNSGEELLVVDASVLDGLVVHNLPGDVVVDYNATKPTGARLIVIRPSTGSYEDFRVFYGEGSTLGERHVYEVLRTKDGGTTHIRFDVDGHEVTALFPSLLRGLAERPSWTQGDAVTPLTVLASTEALDGLSFGCFAGTGG